MYASEVLRVLLDELVLVIEKTNENKAQISTQSNLMRLELQILTHL